MAKPPKYHSLNQTPRSPKHGQYRRPSPPAHGHPIVRADYGTRGADQDRARTWLTYVSELAEPSAIPYAGIRTGEVIGHRLWLVVPEGGELWLCSLTHYRLWLPNETLYGDTNKVVDRAWLSETTIWGGVYAFASAELLGPEAAKLKGMMAVTNGVFGTLAVLGRSPLFMVNGIAFGTIKMWGDVVEHERGYRAEFARLHSIDGLWALDGDLGEIRAKYLGQPPYPASITS